MHISTENISQTVTGRASTAFANKQKVAYGLSIVFTFDLGPLYRYYVEVKAMHSAIANIHDDMANITIAIKYDVRCRLSISNIEI